MKQIFLLSIGLLFYFQSFAVLEVHMYSMPVELVYPTTSVHEIDYNNDGDDDFWITAGTGANSSNFNIPFGTKFRVEIVYNTLNAKAYSCGQTMVTSSATYWGPSNTSVPVRLGPNFIGQGIRYLHLSRSELNPQAVTVFRHGWIKIEVISESNIKIYGWALETTTEVSVFAGQGDGCQSTSMEHIELETSAVFQNGSNLHISNPQEFKLTIYNAVGQRVYVADAAAVNDLSFLSAGVYVAELSAGIRRKTIKVIL